MQGVILGVDVGSSSVKVVAIGELGQPLADCSRGYRSASPVAGYAEQNPDVWWAETAAAVRQCIGELSKRRDPIEVRAIGLTGQMHTFVCLDDAGEVVRPAITWMDSRSGQIARTLAEHTESAGLMSVIRNPIVSGMTLSSLCWMKQNEPESLQRTAAILHAKDYVRYRMTGSLGSDYTDASASLLFDVPGRHWSAEICDLFGLSQAVLPQLFQSWEMVGTLTQQAAEETGLPQGIVVAAGAADQQAAAVGNRVLSAEQIQLMLGTGAQVFSPCAHLPEQYRFGLNTLCHVRDWVVQGSVQNAGLALSWVRETLGLSWDEMFANTAAVTPSSPVFVPYLTGERAPDIVHQPSGAWVGISASTTRNELAASALEAVAASIARTIEVVEEQTGNRTPRLIRCSGGGTRSRAFLQLIADIVGRSLEIVGSENASGHGAALLGGVAAGLYADLDEAVESCGLTADTRIEPVAGDSTAERLEYIRRMRAQVLSLPL